MSEERNTPNSNVIKRKEAGFEACSYHDDRFAFSFAYFDMFSHDSVLFKCSMF